MKDIMTPWQRLLGLLQLDKREIRQIIYYAVFAGIVALSLPLGIQAIINLIQGAQISSSWILLVALVTLGVGFQGALQFMQIRILEDIQQKIFARSSFEFAYRFPKVTMAELRNYYPPELANRFFDTLTIQKGLSKILIDFPAAVLQIVFGIMLLSFYHPFFIVYGVLLVILIYVVFKFTAKKGLETSLLESKSKYKVAHWLQEVARSLISFKLSGKTNLAMSRNDELTSSYLDARENHFKILALQFIQMIGFKILVTAGLLIIGGLLVLNQKMNIGQFVAAEIIILLIIGSVEKLIKGLETFYDVLTSLEKIGQVVDKKLEEQDGIDPFEIKPDLHAELDSIQVNTDEGRAVLKDVSFTFKANDCVLIKGDSGTGKTTLLKVLSGLIPPSSGSIYINDISMEGICLNRYRGSVGQVLPDQYPFEGSILDNITLGDPNITLERLNDVLKNVGLLPFVKQQKDGINTILHPLGQHIPHTVSKRIVLARAIVNAPKLLLMKNPLEHFTTEEARQIIRYLTHPDNNWTIVIASRNDLWKEVCTQTVDLNNDPLKTTNNA